jgi:hypothetical protein
MVSRTFAKRGGGAGMDDWRPGRSDGKKGTQEAKLLTCFEYFTFCL